MPSREPVALTVDRLPVVVDPPDRQPRGVMCRDCAPIGCDGGCDLPPFTD